MTDPQSPASTQDLSSRLRVRRFLTRITLLVERAWPLVVPLLMALSLFAALSWFGIFRVLPDWARIGLLAAVALAAFAALLPLRALRLPSGGDVDRRIESANALEHTPMLVQHDRLTGAEDGFAAALWREHRRRMAEKLNGLGGDLPRAGMPQRDPWGLRSIAPLLLVVAFAFSFGPTGGRLDDAFSAHAGAEAVPPRIDAWVTPPSYTGKPPLFLTVAEEAAPPLVVPAGSEIALRIAGGPGDETLRFTAGEKTADIASAVDEKNAAAPQLAEAPRQFAGKLDSDGTLTLSADGATLAQWAFTVIPDKAPTIRFAGEPRQAANGTLEIGYVIEDDYGAKSAGAEFALAEEPAANVHALYPAPEMPLAATRGKKKDKPARSTRDLTEHVWAGVPVNLTLSATDDADQKARSETKTFILPEKQFLNPLARAVIEQRRMLGMDANAKPQVLNLLDAITLRPEDTFDNSSNYLVLMSARTRLDMATTDDELRGVVDYMWEIALGIEQGSLTDAERRLQTAQKALQEALDRGATDEEIDQLMAELRQAMDQFIREFAQRSQQNQNQAQQMPDNMRMLSQSDLQKMLDQIENLAKSGSKDKAQELLSQLQDMMNNLRMAQPQQGQPGQQNSEMRQQMDKLGDIMRRQQEMMNETHRLDQMQRGDQWQPGQEGEQGEGQQGQQGGNRQMTPEEFADAMRQLQEGQGKLQKELGELRKGLEGLGIQPGQGFGDAGDAMGQAEGSLGRGEGENAVGQQGQALEALRRGAQDMMQQMQAMQGQDGQGQEGERQQSSDRDPLGRPRANTGPDFGDSVGVPDEIDVQRARRILDEIRKRLGNALSPELERSYLERLLKMQ